MTLNWLRDVRIWVRSWCRVGRFVLAWCGLLVVVAAALLRLYSSSWGVRPLLFPSLVGGVGRRVELIGCCRPMRLSGFLVGWAEI